MARDVEAGRAFVRVSIKENLAGLRNISNKMKSWGASMAGMGAKMSLVMAGVNYPLAMAIKNFADFDDAMLSVKGVTQATTAQWQMLSKTAKDLGATTSFTAVQVAALMVELGRAGFKPKEINEMTGAVLNLARATGTDAAVSAGIMSASIRQFELDATAATHIADLLTKTANATFNTVEMLGESLSYAGPVAADFGMSMEDTLAILGALGNVGIQGSNAGTALRRMMIITGAEADKLKGIFGVSFRDAAGNARPLVDVFDDINAATASLGTGERAQKFNEAFGLLGITGASVMGRNVGSVRELQEALRNADGTAADTAAQMDSGLGGAMRILRSAIEGVKIAFGEALAPTLITIGQHLTNINGVIRDFIDRNRGAVVAVAAVVAGVSIGTVALTALGFALMGIGTVLGVIISPLGILIGLVGTATAAFVSFTDTGNWLANTLQTDIGKAFETLKKTFRGMVDAMKAGEWKLAAQLAMEGVKSAFSQAMQTILPGWTEFVKSLVGTFTNGVKAIVATINQIRGTVAAITERVKITLSEQERDRELAGLEDARFFGMVDDNAYMRRKIQIHSDHAKRIKTIVGDADVGLADITKSTKGWLDSIDRAGGGFKGFVEALAPDQAKLQALEEQLKRLRQETTDVTTDAIDRSKPPQTREDIKAATQAAGAVLASGTFSGVGAQIAFSAVGNEQWAKRTAENTERTWRAMEKMLRRKGVDVYDLFQFGGNA